MHRITYLTSGLEQIEFRSADDSLDSYTFHDQLKFFESYFMSHIDPETGVKSEY